jgi:hypothetical protein
VKHYLRGAVLLAENAELLISLGEREVRTTSLATSRKFQGQKLNFRLMAPFYFFNTEPWI